MPTSLTKWSLGALQVTLSHSEDGPVSLTRRGYGAGELIRTPHALDAECLHDAGRWDLVLDTDHLSPALMA